MPQTLPPVVGACPLLCSEDAVCTDLRKAEDEAKVLVGHAIDVARQAAGWNLEEFALAIHRDARQVARWISGKETPQFHVLLAAPRLRGHLLVALAGLDHDTVIETTVRITVPRLW